MFQGITLSIHHFLFMTTHVQSQLTHEINVQEMEFSHLKRFFHQFSSWVFALSLLSPSHPPEYTEEGSQNHSVGLLCSKEFNLAQRGLGFVLLWSRSLMP